jgi:hypothetical protein
MLNVGRYSQSDVYTTVKDSLTREDGTFYYYVYVFLLLCMFRSVYSVFIVPAGTLRLP